VRGKLAEVADFVSPELSDAIMNPEQRRKYDTFAVETSQEFSAAINRLSGAAVSEQELARLKQGLPNASMTPKRFKSAMNATMGRVMFYRRRTSKIRELRPDLMGLPPDAPELVKGLQEINARALASPRLTQDAIDAESDRLLEAGLNEAQMVNQLQETGYITGRMADAVRAGDKAAYDELLKGIQ